MPDDDRAMKPVGSVNEVREKVYEASQELRGSGQAVTVSVRVCVSLR